MTAPVIYDAYGEDGDFQYMNGSVGGGINIITAAGDTSYRAGYARCSVQTVGVINQGVFMVRQWPQTVAQGWTTSRVSVLNSGDVGPSNATFGLLDENLIPRIILQNTDTSGVGQASGPYYVFKINSVGAKTQLGITTSGFSANPGVPDKLDFSFNYSVAGSLVIYINGAQVFTTGANPVDITTDNVATLGGTLHSSTMLRNGTTSWSECIVSDSDTRDMNVRTNVANGPGTVDNWAGAFGNVDNALVDDAVFDTTTTANAIQRYTMGQITVANEAIIAKVTNLRATQGTGALTNIALAENIAGAAHVSAAMPFPTAFGPVQFVQPTNPATGVAWTFADINQAGRESGYQAKP